MHAYNIIYLHTYNILYCNVIYVLLDHVDSVEKKEEVDSESEEEDEDELELDLKKICSEVAAILRKDAVSLKNVLPQTGI